VGGLGKTLIAAGLLMFGFVAYQLWGTGIETARAQNALESEFEDLLAGTTTTDAPVEVIVPDTTAGTVVDSVPVETTAPPAAVRPIEEGDAIARIEMPTIGVDNIVVAGVAKSDLKKGPGHYPETPMPGQLGNSAIAGHRTTYGQPFFDVDKLATGDEIVVTTTEGRFVYRVTGQQIVGPGDYEVISTTDPTKATITITSCHPKWTARERIVISGELDTDASSATPAAPVINYGRPLDDRTDSADAGDAADTANTVVDTVADSVPEEAVDEQAAATSDAVNAEIADAFSDGWFSDPGANVHVALWGLLLAAIGLLSYLASRKAKRDWVGLTIGIVPFVIVLYFFFQNVNRLLPPNL
jgi:sortase A